MSTEAASGRARLAPVWQLIAAAAIGGVLVDTASRTGMIGETPAEAQIQRQRSPGEPVTTVPFNAAEQRQAMIRRMERMSEQMTQLQNRLDRGIDVRVTSMPAIVVEAPHAGQ